MYWIGLALALAPGLAICFYIYLKDRFEREPIKKLILYFFYGVLSTAVTLTISSVLENYVSFSRATVFSTFIDAMLGVALIEEFSKYIFVRYQAYRDADLNEPFDGIVYGVMVAMGFATLENILYVAQGGIEVAVVRMFTAVPLHATCGIVMGYFIGKARFDGKRKYFTLIGLLLATVIHGFYDFFLFISNIPGMYLGAFASLFLAIWFSRRAMRVHIKNSPFRFGIKKDPQSPASLDDQSSNKD